MLVCFASTNTDDGLDTWAFCLPTVQGYFSGVGDLFSAMVLAHFKDGHETLPPLVHAVSKALLAVQQVLLRTHLYSLSQASAYGAATPRPLHPQTQSHDSVLPTDSELDAAVPVNKDPKRKAKRMRLRELRVVQERQLLQDRGEGWPGKKLDWATLLK